MVTSGHVLGLVLQLSNSEFVVGLLLDIACGVVGYFVARNYREVYGMTPWHLPPGVWALFFGLLPILGLVLFLIARGTTRPLPGSGPGWGNSPANTWSGGPPPTQGPPRDAAGTPTAGWQPPGARWAPPAAPAAGSVGSTGAAAMPGSVGSAPVAPPPSAPRSWVADPANRHQLRYWDGERWTEFVSDTGKISTDPI